MHKALGRYRLHRRGVHLGGVEAGRAWALYHIILIWHRFC